MKIFISSAVQIRKITVFASLALWSKREDIKLLCQQIEQDNGVNFAHLSTLLPSFSQRALQNIIQHLQDQKLLYFNHEIQGLQLSKRGKYCARVGLAPTFEQGLYSFWVAEHDITGTLILHFERQSNSPYSNKLTPLPSWFARIDRKRQHRSDLSQDIFSVEKFITHNRNANVSCQIEQAGTLQLQWNIDRSSNQNELLLKGKLNINGKKEALRCQLPEKSSDDVEQLLLSIPDWNEHKNQIDVEINSSFQVEYPENFQRDFSVKHFQFQNKSIYELELQQASIGPKTRHDAQQWGLQLLQHHLRKHPMYFQPQTLREQWNSLTQNTPLSSTQAISEKILLRDAKTTTKQRFLIQANQDIQWRA